MIKLYKQAPNVFTRGKLKESHIPELIAGGYVVVALTTQPNVWIQRKLGPESYFHFPLPDGKVTPAVEQQIKAAVRRVLIESRRTPVIIHCNAGRNRACLIAALVLHEIAGMSGVNALESVRRVRPRAIANPHFEEYLRRIP